MFAILDTNHCVELIDGTALALNLTNPATARDADLFTRIVTVQEITAGWRVPARSTPTGSFSTT